MKFNKTKKPYLRFDHQYYINFHLFKHRFMLLKCLFLLLYIYFKYFLNVLIALNLFKKIHSYTHN